MRRVPLRSQRVYRLERPARRRGLLRRIQRFFALRARLSPGL
jgi:hypothetical protein